MKKQRLDRLLVEQGYFDNIVAAQRAILAGLVRINTDVVTKAGEQVALDTKLTVLATNTYVSRGGTKLAGALEDFKFDVKGLHCLDAGASTGGFTDCLLQAGAARVTAVDVAYGQFAWSLRTDSRVCVYERSNISKLGLTDIGGVPFDLIVCDLSFTSLSRVLNKLATFTFAGNVSHNRSVEKSCGHTKLQAELTASEPLRDNHVMDSCKVADSFLIALIKPQFELPDSVVADGVVTDASLHEQTLRFVVEAAQNSMWQPQAMTFSRLRGPKGNIEFFLLARCVAQDFDATTFAKNDSITQPKPSSASPPVIIEADKDIAAVKYVETNEEKSAMSKHLDDEKQRVDDVEQIVALAHQYFARKAGHFST